MVESFAEKFFITQEEKEQGLAGNKRTLMFFNEFCESVGLPGVVDAFYLAEVDSGSVVRAIVKNEVKSPYDDELEQFQTYEIEFGDFSVNVMEPDVFIDGGVDTYTVDDVAYFRNKKYQELMQKKAKSEHCLGDYKAGCNRFNGMKYYGKLEDYAETESHTKTSSLI